MRTCKTGFAPVTKLASFLLLAVLSPAAGAQVTSVVQILSTPNPVVEGQKTTFTAGVNWTDPDNAPSGSIKFTDTVVCSGKTLDVVLGTISLGSATSPDPGAGSLEVSAFPCVGQNLIVASYSGDSHYSSGQSQPLYQTVLTQFTPTSVLLTSSLNPSIAGETITFSASLAFTLTDSTEATGTVAFEDKNTGKVLGTETVRTSGGAGKLSTGAALTISLAAGTYAVEAIYSGDNIYSGATSPVLHEVVQEPGASQTTTSLSASLTQSTVGESIRFTATVKSSSGGTPSGPVSFYDAKTLLGALSLDSAGQAVLTTSSLTAGTHSITAAYGGAVTFDPSSSAAVSVTVKPKPLAATTTTVSSSANPVPAGTPIVISAKVTSTSAGTPTGTITFEDQSSGVTTVLGSSTMQKGVASLKAAFSAGTYVLSARYNGDSTFAASTGTLTEVVTRPALTPTATAITSSANPSRFGEPVTFTVHVTGGSVVPSGTVILTAGPFRVNLPLNSAGRAIFTTSALWVGRTSASAAYTGNSTHAGSVSPNLVQTVEAASTITTVRSSLNPSPAGLAVTLVAQVSVVAPGSGAPGGSVTFVADGTRTLCSAIAVMPNHAATCSTTALSAGNHTVTASYGGSYNFAKSNGSLAQRVLRSSLPISAHDNGFTYNRSTRLYSTRLLLTNTSNAQIAGPIQLLFRNVAPDVSVANATGTYLGAPYITIPSGLNPGQSTSLVVEFSDFGLSGIAYTVEFYSGSL